MSQKQPLKPRSEENLPAELVSQFLANQAQDLKNTQQEIELRKLNEENSYKYGCKALDIQAADKEADRAHRFQFMKYGFWLTIVLLIFLSAFVWFCIDSGNVDLIVSGLKVLAYMVPPSIGGYFLGYNRGKKHSDSSNAPYIEPIQ